MRPFLSPCKYCNFLSVLHWNPCFISALLGKMAPPAENSVVAAQADQSRGVTKVKTIHPEQTQGGIKMKTTQPQPMDTQMSGGNEHAPESGSASNQTTGSKLKLTLMEKLRNSRPVRRKLRPRRSRSESSSSSSSDSRGSNSSDSSDSSSSRSRSRTRCGDRVRRYHRGRPRMRLVTITPYSDTL